MVNPALFKRRPRRQHQRLTARGEQSSLGMAPKAFYDRDWETRQKHFELLRGPSMRIIVGDLSQSVSANGGTRRWDIPKALLCRYSCFFRNLCEKQSSSSHEEKITLANITDEPDVFALFVEFIHLGYYSNGHDKYTKLPAVFPSCKAWVLADHLDAPEFKNYAMKQVYIRHSQIGVSAEDVEYACKNTKPVSHLRQYFYHRVAQFWSDKEKVDNPPAEKENWGRVWSEHPDFRDELFYLLKDPYNVLQPLGKYLDASEETAEPILIEG